jgi:hypothetical protein
MLIRVIIYENHDADPSKTYGRGLGKRSQNVEEAE